MLRHSLVAPALLIAAATAQAGPFDPQAGLPGSLAIPRQSSRFVGWATGVASLERGPRDIADPSGPLASFGTPAAALGAADGSVVSLGDGGSITLTFDHPIVDGPGADFAVFENGFALGGAGLAYLELAFVEVSSDGRAFVRFPSTSLTPTDAQVGGFGPLDASDLHNLAGKHVGGFGTPFDVADLAGASPALDLSAVRFVRLIDVVGSIDPRFARRDASGRPINDPYATAFASSGFDLDAVGVIHAVPEPPAAILGLSGLVALAASRGLARGRRAG